MTSPSFVTFARPFIAALATFVLVAVALGGRSVEMTAGKLGLIASFILTAGIILTGIQVVRKKEFTWTASFAGVMLLGLVIAVAAVALKVGSLPLPPQQP